VKVVTSVREMQRLAEAWRRQGRRIGFVPTMGCLHVGHLSLIRIAKQRSDIVVASIFVNPTQFGPKEDFKRYPRDITRDKKLAVGAGCDVLFVPRTQDMYPQGYATYVMVEGLSKGLCGRSRPIHFRGVTTVVAKLFHIVKPHLAVFGQKDAQQAVILQRMARDLNFDTRILVAPIVREKDGLAMSSRNVYLSTGERKQALVLSRALRKAKQMVSKGERKASVIKNTIIQLIRGAKDAVIDYVEVVHPETLEDLTLLGDRALVALAVKFGSTRLIDNTLIKV
jgi:pantoate--beta-alanine ligase